MTARHALAFESCPACGVSTAASEILFTAQLFGKPCRILRCRRCALVFKEWFTSGPVLDGLYSGDYVHFASTANWGAAELNSAKQKLDRCRRLLRQSGPVRLIDVGCGSGGFVRIARALGYDAEGVDPYLPDELKAVHLSRASPDDLAPHSYDIATLLNVAEHVPDPQPLFASLIRLLKPAGVLLVTCPYGDSLARRFHKARWTHLALDEHVLFWTPKSLRLATRRAGFRGRESWRIAGSPFPFGRATDPHVSGEGTAISELPQTSTVGLQSTVWGIARRLQAHAPVANAIRQLVHVTRSGDYLEYAVSSGR